MFILSLLFNAHMNALGELKCSYGGDRVGSPASDKQPGIARLASRELACWSWLSVRLACFLADYQKVLAPNHVWLRSARSDAC